MLLAAHIMSFIVAPLFRTKLNEQFMLGARNQAFTTEYVSGLETVKSLQMEPQLTRKNIARLTPLISLISIWRWNGLFWG